MFTRLIDDMGLLPYTERLSTLKLTILAERRSRADLIEAYKIVGGSVSYGSQLLRISRSGTNRISKAGPDNKSHMNLLSERVINFWNVLPLFVKKWTIVDNFKVNLENYKK